MSPARLAFVLVLCGTTAVAGAVFASEVTGRTSGLERPQARHGDLPAGTEACRLSGWSNDPDPNGMNVRSGPTASSPVIGKVPAPFTPPEDAGTGDRPLKAEFRIVGYKDGWFLIEGIEAPGAPYGLAPPAGLAPFGGRGWVSARLVGAALAHGDLPTGRLYTAPEPNASYRAVTNAAGEPAGPGDIARRVLACSGPWGHIETETGLRGWWRGLCSNQVTTCN